MEQDEIWLALINAKNLKELKEMAGFIMDKKNQQKFINDVKQASKDKLILSEWELIN